MWDGCSPSDSATPPAAPSAADTLTVGPLVSPAHKSLPPWEAEQILSRPAPLPRLSPSCACVAATPRRLCPWQDVSVTSDGAGSLLPSPPKAAALGGPHASRLSTRHLVQRCTPCPSHPSLCSAVHPPPFTSITLFSGAPPAVNVSSRHLRVNNGESQT